MTTDLYRILLNLSKTLDKPVLDDPRLDFTPSPQYFPLIGKQPCPSTSSIWPWNYVTTLGKEARIPKALCQSEIHVVIGSFAWNDKVSFLGSRSDKPIRRRAPLFIASAEIVTIPDPNNPDAVKQAIRLTEPPAPNTFLLSWLKSFGIDATIDPSASLAMSFLTSDKRLAPEVFEEVHFGLFLRSSAQLARSLNPDLNPQILKSRMAALLIGDNVADLPHRAFNPDFDSPIPIDQDQKEAILAALRGETFLLLGPPGCGKTQTIAVIILILLRIDPHLKIGVASPVAAALDALRRLIADPAADYREIVIGRFHKPEPLDLLIVDESSRATTAEIFPFAAQASQCIVIGDPNQTPPPVAAPRLDAEDASVIHRASRNPNFGYYELRNHYRSYHPDLAMISNTLIYNGRLRIVPAPHKEDYDGLCIHFVPAAPAHADNHTTHNTVEAAILAKALVSHAVSAASLGLNRSRMVVGWTYKQTRQVEAAIKFELKKQKLDPDILSSNPDEPFVCYTAADVQGQERDETWISFGHGVDPKKQILAYANQPTVDMSKGVMQKLNVVLTRSRLATHVYHSIIPLDLLEARPNAEIVGLLALINTEMVDLHSRFQISPLSEPNFVAQRRASGDPTMPNPVAVNLASVIGVRDENDPPNCWRYGLFRSRPDWTEEDADAYRDMLVAKRWNIVNY